MAISEFTRLATGGSNSKLSQFTQLVSKSVVIEQPKQKTPNFSFAKALVTGNAKYLPPQESKPASSPSISKALFTGNAKYLPPQKPLAEQAKASPIVQAIQDTQKPQEKKPSIGQRIGAFFSDKERFNVVEQFKSIIQATPEQRVAVANKIIFDLPISQEERVKTRTQDLRGMGQGDAFRLLTMTGQSVLGTLEAAEGIFEWAGTDRLKPVADKLAEWQQVLEPEDRNFLDTLAGGVGSVATFFVPGVGVMRGVQMIAKVAPAAAVLFGSVTSTLLEAATEAGAIYRELKSKGASDEEASEGAAKDFWINAIIVGITNKLGIFGDQLVGIKRALVSAPMEGIQEATQQITSNIIAGRDPMEGVLESSTVGTLIGGGIGAATPQGVNIPTNILPGSAGLSIKEVEDVPEEFAKFVQESTDRDVTTLNKKELLNAMQEYKQMLPTSEGGSLFNTITSPTQGIDFTREEMKYLGMGRGFMTDAFVALIGKPADLANQDIAQKEMASNKRYVAKVGAVEDIDKQAKELLDHRITSEQSKSKFDLAAVKAVIPEGGKNAWLQGVSGTKTGTEAVISDGQTQLTVDADKLRFIRKYAPDAKIQIVGEEKPVKFVSRGRVVGLLMPIKIDDKSYSVDPGFKPASGSSILKPSKRRGPTIPLGSSRQEPSASRTKGVPALRSEGESEAESNLTSLPSNRKNVDFISAISNKQYSTLRELGKERQTEFEAKIEKATDLTPETRIKEASKIEGKVRRYEELGQDIGELYDVLASRVIMQNVEQIDSLLVGIVQEFGEANVIEIQNSFDNPSVWGYYGVNIQLRLEDGFPVELQLHTSQSVEIAEKIHPLYEKWRDLAVENLSVEEIVERSNDLAESQRIADSIMTGAPVKPGQGISLPATQGLLPGAVAVEGEGFFMTEQQKKTQSPEARITRENENIRKDRANRARREELRGAKRETLDKAKAIYDQKISKIKTSKDVLQQRRLFVRATQKFFGLTDAELKRTAISKDGRIRTVPAKDIRLMTNLEFKTFLDDMRRKAEYISEIRQAKNELMQQIQDKEIDIENLREVMKLPPISQMSLNEIRQMDEALKPYMQGDVFLSKRKLEVIDRTELEGVKTYREVREVLAKKLGVSPEDLGNIKVDELDRFKGFAGLAEKNAFFKMVVSDTTKIKAIRDAEFLEIKDRMNELASQLKTGIAQKLIPQQKNISRWFQATDKSTADITPQEAAVIKEMQAELLKAKDYLIKQQMLKKGIASDRYYPYVRRSFPEATKEDGFIKAFKEYLAKNNMDEQAFGILDGDTGQILANDKFFGFALQRTGKIVPTENVIGAYLTYMRTFKTKQALDEITPVMMTYAESLTPKGVTKTGLALHGSLIRFMNEWLNTQKGRRVKGFVKQGGKLELGIRAALAFTNLLFLGGNVVVTVATQIGEQVINYELSGPVDFVRGKIRAITPRGKRISKKYANVIGENPWKQLIEPARNVGDRLSEGLFVMFSDANRRRMRNFVLGDMTQGEWSSETISPDRLAALKIANGRYGMVSGAGSIVGATPEAGIGKQFKSWALPIIGTTARNVKYLTKYMKSLGKDNKVEAKRALVEFRRIAEIGLFVLIIRALTQGDDDDDTLIGRMKNRAYQEALTLYGALSPKFILSPPVLIKLASDIGNALTAILKLEKYTESKFGEYESGDLKGPNQLKNLLTPRLIKQFEQEKQKSMEDIRQEILQQIESGEVSIAVAKENFIKEIQSLASKEKDNRFKLPMADYTKDLAARIEAGELTTQGGKEELMDYLEKNVDSIKPENEDSLWDVVGLYARAFGTDMPTAFATLFYNNRIEKIENGTIIIMRNTGVLGEDTKFSTEFREDMGATKETVADHIIPRGLGGLDVRSNMQLISVEEWEGNTQVEVYLINKLYAGLIDKERARELILDFKEGRKTAEEIMGS